MSEFPCKKEFWTDSNGVPYTSIDEAKFNQAKIDISAELFRSNSLDVYVDDFIDFIKRTDYKVLEKFCENIFKVKDYWEKI